MTPDRLAAERERARAVWRAGRLLQEYAPAAAELAYRIGDGRTFTDEEAWEYIGRRPTGFHPEYWSDYVWEAQAAAAADPREDYSWDDLLVSNREFLAESPGFLREDETPEAGATRLAEEEREQYDRDWRRSKAEEWQRFVAAYIERYLVQEPPISGDEAEKLTRRQWESVALICHRRLSPEEAAEVLKVAATTVQRHLEEAAKALGLTTKELRRRTLG